MALRPESFGAADSTRNSVGTRLRKALHRWLVSCILFTVSSCQLAAAAESQFYLQCERFLPIANSFASECQQRARPFTRTFYPSGGSRGEVESYSTYFKALDGPSHFVLGCVLDFKHKINFLGLYYSSSPLDMARFDDFPIVFIDPSDNVGFQIDDVQRTLVAVRQFVTDVIPPRLTGRPKNCEDPHIESMAGARAEALVHFRKIDQDEMEFCNGDYCRPVRYLTFGGVHTTPIIYSFYDLFLIDSDGVLMLRDDYFKATCTWKRDAPSVYNFIREMCTKAQ